MSDFYQTGVISTLHRLVSPEPDRVDRLEAALKRYGRTLPIGLLLPCLYSELETPAMPAILEELKKLKYIREIVIALGMANQTEFERAKKFFSSISTEKRLLWIDSPRVQLLFQELENQGISTGSPGKGRAVWMALGYMIASERSKVIALHDCDILTYDRELLARLCYPIANPSLGYEYAKGYYARYTNQFNGRVTRLFFTPVVRTLLNMVGYHPYLVFLDSFRYPLAGEFALTADLARNVRIPSDWGLEIGFLGEVFRNCNVRHVCEVDLCERYDHKHQALSADNPQQGLMRMAVDITMSLLRTLAAEGTILSEGFIRTFQISYLRIAQDAIKKFSDDAAINGLAFDRHAESTAVEAYAKAIELAGRKVLEDPLGGSYIPNWNRVISASPDFLDRLKVAVDDDNQSPEEAAS